MQDVSGWRDLQSRTHNHYGFPRAVRSGGRGIYNGGVNLVLSTHDYRLDLTHVQYATVARACYGLRGF